MPSDFAKNLRVLCAQMKSVSALCRELSLNRQQFARYLTGESTPSPYNMGKIADYFRLSVADLALPNGKFIKHYSEAGSGAVNRKRPLVTQILGAGSEPLEQFRRFVGYYSVYMQSPSDPSKLLKSLIQLSMNGDQLISRWEESFTRAEDSSVQVSSYEGVVRVLNGFLFIVDAETSMRETILETILRIPYRRRTDILTGVTMGMTTGRQRIPFASIVVFKSLGRGINRVAAARNQSGFHDPSSKIVEPVVRDIFSRQENSHVFPRILSQV